MVGAATAKLVRLLERDRANSGLRVVVETMLADFNNHHLAGQCTDPVCVAYLTELENNGIIKKLGSAAGLQLYQLTGKAWSKVGAIEHFAEW